MDARIETILQGGSETVEFKKSLSRQRFNGYDVEGRSGGG